MSERFLGTPYVHSPLGEGSGVDPDPTFRLDAVDCLTFVEQAMAMSLARSDAEVPGLLERLRYASTPRYEDRNHLMEAQWLPNNQRKGFLVDVTRRYGAEDTVRVQKTLTPLTWTSRSSLALGLPKEHQPRGTYSLDMIPLERVLERARNVPSGTILVVLREDLPLKATRVTHLGFVVQKGKRTWLRHARRADGNGRVVDEDLETFLARNAKYDKWRVSGVSLYEPRTPTRAAASSCAPREGLTCRRLKNVRLCRTHRLQSTMRERRATWAHTSRVVDCNRATSGCPRSRACHVSSEGVGRGSGGLRLALLLLGGAGGVVRGGVELGLLPGEQLDGALEVLLADHDFPPGLQAARGEHVHGSRCAAAARRRGCVGLEQLGVVLRGEWILRGGGPDELRVSPSPAAGHGADAWSPRPPGRCRDSRRTPSRRPGTRNRTACSTSSCLPPGTPLATGHEVSTPRFSAWLLLPGSPRRPTTARHQWACAAPRRSSRRPRWCSRTRG